MKYYFFLLILILTVFACTKDDNSDSIDNGQFSTSCGVVFQGDLYNPIDSSRGVTGTAEAIGSNQIALQTKDSRILVKLHGIDVSDNSSREFLSRFDGQAVFFEAVNGCTTIVSGGGTASVGHLFTIDGRSYAEELIRAGLGNIAIDDVCSGILVGQCYEALREEHAPLQADISNFLWKPVSERDGNLVVLLNPAGATIVVNGEILTDFGSSNGRGTTARADKSGCDFGTNIEIQVFDSFGNQLIFPDGETTFIIPDGCNRVEF